MFRYPGFDPVAVHLGPLAIRWYGLMYLVGFAGGWYLARKRAASLAGSMAGGATVRVEQVDDLVFYTALGVILGGRIGYMLFYGTAELIANPLSIFRIWEGGMSFHGGFLGVLTAMALYGRKIGVRFFDLTDFIAPLVPIGLCAGRIGNFINGELWGKVTDVPWAFMVDGSPRHGSQLYEAGLEGIALFVILWTFSSRPRPRGAVSALFLLCYGIFRFAIEFVRMPDAQIGYLALGWVTMGQILSFPMIIAGLGGLWLAFRRGPLPARQGV
jgi:phosphatidylglycerol:prolipoprotein diacylglycerol transferase